MGLNIFNFLLIHLSLKNSNENLVKKSEKNTVAFEILNYDTHIFENQLKSDTVY